MNRKITIDDVVKEAREATRRTGRDVSILLTVPEDRYSWSVEVLMSRTKGEGEVFRSISDYDSLIVVNRGDLLTQSLEDALKTIKRIK